MSDYLQHYLEWGLSQIIVIDHRAREVQSGYGLELTWETVVACKGDECVKVIAHERRSYAPGAGGSSVGRESEAVMTKAEYQKVAKDKPILDTPAELKRIRDQKAAMEANYARNAANRPERLRLAAELNDIAPSCHQCGTKMTHKKGKYGWFWGCSYPHCNGTASMSDRAKRILADLQKLS